VFCNAGERAVLARWFSYLDGTWGVCDGWNAMGWGIWICLVIPWFFFFFSEGLVMVLMSGICSVV
jgi:hypothetical protein